MLLGPGEQLLLSDFGIAVMWSGTRSISTQKVIGTHGYMAPEQFQGHPRPASDQYSLAITTYEWLSGSRPMADAPLGLGMLQMVRPETAIPAVRRVAPHLPPKLDDVLQRALASDWQARFPSVREFAEKLTRAANSGGPTTYRPIGYSNPGRLIPLCRHYNRQRSPSHSPPRHTHRRKFSLRSYPDITSRHTHARTVGRSPPDAARNTACSALEQFA